VSSKERVPVPVVVLTGTVGSGKSTLLGEMSDVLVERGAPHLALDVDALSYTFPRPDDDPYGQRIADENLAAVWRNAERAGARRALLARVVEDLAELDAYRGAIPGADIVVCRVVASADVVALRLRQREVGSARDWHLRRAPELDAILDRAAVEDVAVANEDRPLRAVATEALAAVGWVETP
jgi:molybdopterin-guanine dinucleotide biosynthesis protein